MHLDFDCLRLPCMCRDQYDTILSLIWYGVKGVEIHPKAARIYTYTFITSTFWFGKAFCFRSLDDSLSVCEFLIQLGFSVFVLFGAIIPWNFLTVKIYLHFRRLTFLILVDSSTSKSGKQKLLLILFIQNFSRFWLAKITHIIHHNQLLLTKFRRICHIDLWSIQTLCGLWAWKLGRCVDSDGVSGYWTFNREDLGLWDEVDLSW